MTRIEGGGGTAPSISSSGIRTHGDLGGLGADDHTIYLLASGARQLTGNWDVGAFNISVPTAASTPRVELLSSGDLAFTRRPFPPDNPVITADGATVMTMLGVVGVRIDLCVGITMASNAAPSALNFQRADTGIQYAGNDRIIFDSSAALNTTMHFPSTNPINTGDGAVLWNFGTAAPQNVTVGLGFSMRSNTASPTIVQGGGLNVGWQGTGTAPLVLGAEVFASLGGTGIVTLLVGLRSQVRITAAGTVTESIAHEILAPTFSVAQPTTHAGQRIKNQGVVGIATSYGLIVEDQSGSTTNVAISVGTGDHGFYGVTPVALQTGVAVTAAAIHAALVNLGLITA